ncbi:MAG: site-specific integrase [Acidobacteria bacterium]|nr:site-specific integrase [Acidobacteriota bacterium]
MAGALVPQPAVREHMRSVPYADAPAAMQRIETCRATLSAKACLRFQILTAVRPSEARLATWGEIGEDALEWRIPACRMKRKREHVVPLVAATVALLSSVRSLRRHDGDDALVFPSPQTGAGSLSAATVAGVMKSAGLADAGSPHGWRSTFRTWASECADADYAVMETSLAHAVGSAVERSYSRSKFLKKRCALLDAWSEFLAGNVAVIAEGGLSLGPTERS